MLSCPNCQNLIDETRTEKKTERFKSHKKGEPDVQKEVYQCPSCKKFADPFSCGTRV